MNNHYEICTTRGAVRKVNKTHSGMRVRKPAPYGGRYWPSLYTFFCQLAILSALMAVILGCLSIALMGYLWIIDYAISRG